MLLLSKQRGNGGPAFKLMCVYSLMQYTVRHASKAGFASSSVQLRVASLHVNQFHPLYILLVCGTYKVLTSEKSNSYFQLHVHITNIGLQDQIWGLDCFVRASLEEINMCFTKEYAANIWKLKTQLGERLMQFK